MTDPKRILEAARSVLLVDWPDAGVPRALLRAGIAVFTYAPDRYSVAEIVAERPGDAGPHDALPPRNDGEAGFLVFRRIDGRPPAVDVVNVYRGAEEHAAIIAHHVLPLGAKVLWLQPPVTSDQAAELASRHGLVLIEGADIAETARSLGRQ